MTSPLQKAVDILSQMPKKTQKYVMSCVDFDTMNPKEVYRSVIEAMYKACKSVSQRELLDVMRSLSPTDDEILEAFKPSSGGTMTPLYFSEDQIDFIVNNVYRNRDGDFRLIPHDKNCTCEQMPLEGLKADDDIIAARLLITRTAPNGAVEEFNGLKELRKQSYDGPYDGVFKKMAPNLKRIRIISSFAKDEPHGFFVKDHQMFRNVCSQITKVQPSLVNEKSLHRAMFLTYLVAGGRVKDWEALYNLVHFMVNVPNSATGYILYLNDFDAGGNGKSKFISMLQRMFGDSFTAFSVQQLRFTMSLMGKRLVSISEYEENENAKPLQALIKSMTGRDKFQYEGKGVDPIVAETYQNFVISSNRYIYFEDSGIKRRIQNFHCSNLLHLILNRFTRNSSYLNQLFGNIYDGEALDVSQQMAHSFLDFVQNDKRDYMIPIRPQNIVLGSLKNPVLRALFSPTVNFDRFVDDATGKASIQLGRLVPDAKPEQLNYAASTIQSWLPHIQFSMNRTSDVLSTDMTADELTAELKLRLGELDAKSNSLRNRDCVHLEIGDFAGFNSKALFDEFIGPYCEAYKIPVKIENNIMEVG